jgi:hypothetical protein
MGAAKAWFRSPQCPTQLAAVPDTEAEQAVCPVLKWERRSKEAYSVLAIVFEAAEWPWPASWPKQAQRRLWRQPGEASAPSGIHSQTHLLLNLAQFAGLSVHSVRCALLHLVAYGSMNKYIPVKNCKASMAAANRPSLAVYFPCTTAIPLMMTATVKAMDSQRWVC